MTSPGTSSPLRRRGNGGGRERAEREAQHGRGQRRAAPAVCHPQVPARARQVGRISPPGCFRDRSGASSCAAGTRSISAESERRSVAGRPGPTVARLVPRPENLMTKRLLVIAAVSLGATALTFAPSAHPGGFAGVATARAATAGTTPPVDPDAGLDDTATGGLDQTGVDAPVDDTL